MNNNKPEIDRIFHALGDPTRRAMVEKLSQGPASVSRLAEPFGITLACLLYTSPYQKKARSTGAVPLGFLAGIAPAEANPAL